MKTQQSDTVTAHTPIAPRAESPSAPAEGPVQDGASQGDREIRIAEQAYYRYERRNGGPGDAMQDWLEAEREVDGGKK